MTKKLLILILFFHSALGYSQDKLAIDSELIFDEYNSMSVLNAFELNDSIMLLAARLEISETDKNKLGLYKINDKKIIAKTIISPKEFLIYKDLIPTDNQFLIIGSLFVEDDLEQDCLSNYDEKGNCTWTLKLEKKYEGILQVKKSSFGYIAISSGINGLFRYEIKSNGEIQNKVRIPINEYLVDAHITRDYKMLIVSLILDEKGETEKCNLSLFDSNMSLLNQTSPDISDKFFLKKIIEYKNGFLIAGNEEGEYVSIPKIFIFNENLELINNSTFHYEPVHYKFKSDFQINDLIYDKSKDTFWASGITKVVNDETNIVIQMDENNLLNYKLIDLTDGVWENNKIIVKSNNKIVFFGDSRKNDENETEIKMIKLK